MAVLVVGMHRSGTSALSGMLAKLGVAVPKDQHPADKHNERGYFEPQRIIDFHERLLARLGSPSNDPLPLRYGWVRSPVGAAAAEELAEILDDEFAGAPLCLFKDPRMCRLLPVWNAALKATGRAAVAILPFRDPIEVVGSLAARASLGRPYSLCMWLQHVVLGERFTRGTPRSFVAYDRLLADWRAVSAKLQRELKMTWPRDAVRAGPAVDAFLTAELRHHAARPDALNPYDPMDALCLRVWAGLQRFAADPNDAEAMAAFDAVWADFEAGLGLFAPLVHEFQRANWRLGKLSQRQAASLQLHAQSVRDQADQSSHALARIETLETALRGRNRELRAAARWIDQVQADTRRELERADLAVRDTAAHLAHTRAHVGLLEARLAELETSTFWRISYPLRRALEKAPWLRGAARDGPKLAWWTLTFQLGRKLRERALASTALAPAAPLAIPETGSGQAAVDAPEALPPEVESPTATPSREHAISGHILFVSGEPDTPGHRYRVARWAEAAERGGATTQVISFEEIPQNPHEVRRADLVFLWRVPWNEGVETLFALAREAATPVVFDTDDLIFDPSFAKPELIDGIRSQDLDEAEVAIYFGKVKLALEQAAVCTAPTHYLAQRMRLYDKPCFVLPNGFDEGVLERSRLAVRRRRQTQADGLVRIGYATGSRTHQKDFAQCAEAVADVLRTHAEARLVIFVHQDVPLLDLSEFPSMEGLEAQVELRELVPLEQLPEELARFDISIAPLEAGNPFCESKSELKFFEAALVGVPTVASPTEPFRRAIRDGETGFLAADIESWRAALTRLVEDTELRRRLARTAFWEAIVEYGPERRIDAFLSMAEQLIVSPRRAGRAFELDLLRRQRARAALPFVPDHEIVFERDRLRPSAATVVIPLHNYRQYVTEALESVLAQTVADLDLIVVNDGSTDDSEAVALRWLEANHERFNRALLIRNRSNSGLGFTRNVGFANAETPYVLPLDADNRLRPHCVQQTLAVIERAGAAFAYPRLRYFGDGDGGVGMGFQPWSAARFTIGNYIDAMALVRRVSWAEAGGYDHVRHGWEDFDLWCRMVERGLFGVQAPEYLADYRVHGGSMLHTQTDVLGNKLRLIEDMERRHPWLRLERPALPTAQAAPQEGPAAGFEPLGRERP